MQASPCTSFSNRVSGLLDSNEPDAYAAGENYFPDGMTPPRLYEPTERGLEAKIKARLDELRALDARASKRK